MFSAIVYDSAKLRLIDQRRLPAEEIWLECNDVEAVAKAIEDMVVRGAPAIGCTAAFGLAIDADRASEATWAAYRPRFEAAWARLAGTRPTAVNLFYALDRMKARTADFTADTPIAAVRQALDDEAKKLYAEDLATCRAIGDAGLSLVKDGKVRVLTHCNTGSLATAGYGTALGVVRSLFHAGKLDHVYADETRPYLQGARLTAFELKSENIPYTLNVDAAAGFLMAENKVDWVVVGADRIAANGDTANKIGTYALAIMAKYHNVAFYVAAPLSTFDLTIRTGADIPVEMRSPREVTHNGDREVAPSGTNVVNPAFDVTPAELITGIITERGVIRPPFTDGIAKIFSTASDRG